MKKLIILFLILLFTNNGCKQKHSQADLDRQLYKFVQVPMQGDYDLVKRHYKKGANLNLRNKSENIYGYTPLLAAAGATGSKANTYTNQHDRDTCELEAVKIIKFLVANGADLYARDETRLKRNALHLAALGGWSKVIQTLVELGIKIDSRDSANATALMNAGTSGCLDAVKACISLGADVNAVMNGGYTALDATEQYNTEEMYAMGYVKCREHDEIIKYLLSLGAKHGKEID